MLAVPRRLFVPSAMQSISHIDADLKLTFAASIPFVWPAPGSEDTELGVLMEPEVDHGEAEVHAGVQA